MNQVTIDFVTIRPDGSYCLRLLEEGPWEGEPEEELRRIQDRLYTVIEVVADGTLAERYPASQGKHFFIKLDCFRISQESIAPFFDRFVSTIKSSPDWALACERITLELCDLGEN